MLPHAEFYIICHSDKFVGTAMFEVICGNSDVPNNLWEQRYSDKFVGTAMFPQRLWEQLFPQFCRNSDVAMFPERLWELLSMVVLYRNNCYYKDCGNTKSRFPIGCSHKFVGMAYYVFICLPHPLAELYNICQPNLTSSDQSPNNIVWAPSCDAGS